MKDKVLLPIIMAIIFTTVACDEYKSQSGRLAVATVGDVTLYYDEIAPVITPDMSANDSISEVHNNINQWAKTELLKLRAIENLPPELKDNVERQIEEIRTSLLIHQYEELIIGEKMDTIVSYEEMENFYSNNQSLFALNNNIVKVLFIKIPSDIPNLDRVSGWYRSERPEDIANLERFCFQFADKYDDFGEEWIQFRTIIEQLPLSIENQEQYLTRNRYIEVNDSLYHYFVNIKEYRLQSTLAPFEYATNWIKDIILNARKIEFLQNLENGIFSEAMRQNLFKIH